MLTSFTLTSARRCELLDITPEVARLVAAAGVKEGTVSVFVPHTTAAVTINENADPDVRHDLLQRLATLVPERVSGDRHAEGNSDAHLKSSLLGASVNVIIADTRLLLGTWQGIYFCEFDGPRQRTVYVKVLAA